MSNFVIQKTTTGNFYHIYNDARTKVSVSDFDVVLDDVALTFIIQCKNGSNIPSQAISISLIQVVDLSVSTSPIAFSGVDGLIELLKSIGYTPYLQSLNITEPITIYKKGQVGVFGGVTQSWIDANFDGTGLGINEALGWAKRNGNNGTKNQQGKVSLNQGTAQYNIIGANGGSANAVLIAHNHDSAVLADGKKGVNALGTGTTSNGYVLVEAEANQNIVKTSIKGQSENGTDSPSEDGMGKNMPPYLIDLWVERVSDLIFYGGRLGQNLVQVLERGGRPYKAIPINYTFELEDITKWIYAGDGGVATLDDAGDEFLVSCSIPIVVDVQTLEFKCNGTELTSNLLDNTPLGSDSLLLYKGDSAELKKVASGAWWLQVTRFNETRYRQAFIRVLPDAGVDPPVVNLIVAGDFPDGEFTTTWDTISHFYLNSQSGLFIDEKTIFPPFILFSDGGVYSGAYSITRVDNNILEFYCNDYNGDPLPLANTQLTIIINN